MGAKNYQDLIVWQRSMDFVELVYQATKAFPKEELYGLTSQLRRAAVSIPSNIAEGQGRTSPKEFIHFLSIAHGSLREAETQIMIAQRLGYIQPDQVTPMLNLASEIGKMINGLTATLSQKAERRAQ